MTERAYRSAPWNMAKMYSQVRRFYSLGPTYPKMGLLAYIFGIKYIYCRIYKEQSLTGVYEVCISTRIFLDAACDLFNYDFCAFRLAYCVS